jgi:hypothetical protein
MKGKIVLEEHFTTALNNSLWDASGESARNGKAYMDDVVGKLLDTERRIVEMDQCGIDIAILSLTSPGAQSLLDTRKATDFAKQINDHMTVTLVMSA